MATIVLTILISIGVVFGLKSFLKGRSSCNDCACSCPVKDEIAKKALVKK